ncbi:MAG: hypothetical protein ACI9EQ_000722, partial [Bacteroidia bacterium]
AISKTDRVVKSDFIVRLVVNDKSFGCDR